MHRNTAERRSGLNSEQGFTLIELLIVMSIIIIIVTIALPNITKYKRTGNETSAVGSIRALVAAELQYQQTYPQNGYACSVGALGGEKGATPTPAAAGLIAADLASGHKAGYTFAIVNCTKVTINNQDQYTGYEITAVPDAVGKTGDRGFCSDDSQQIKVDPKGGTNCSVPLQ
ncbi:prepilin-type N-terminal cleavage/methylation domain-containing protein [Terriglobus aquaticus]|uniref:Prepilin-type N-terminal cleavage/methylation domain-containing protein n=1 Tax=Terriglobus aquaticus TaxID=940139 RepID=A0ABW9KIN7_9BACT|nr:prepilin-type N-terminal cleavage/methylation domain-containing protein [Terriglobus aquaticus]